MSLLCLRALQPQRGRLAGPLQVNEVVFSPSASHWATCSDDGSVRVWSLASMELLIQFQVLNQVPGALRAEPDPPPSPAWSLYPPSVSIPALGLGPCSPRPGECPCLPPVGPQSCLCLAWSPPSCRRPEQQQVAAGYSDGTLRVFSVTRIAMELKMHPHRAALTALAYSADGEQWSPWGLRVLTHLGRGPGACRVTLWPCLAQVRPSSLETRMGLWL